jgi:hypothetical protein
MGVPLWVSPFFALAWHSNQDWAHTTGSFWYQFLVQPFQRVLVRLTLWQHGHDQNAGPPLLAGLRANGAQLPLCLARRLQQPGQQRLAPPVMLVSSRDSPSIVCPNAAPRPQARLWAAPSRSRSISSLITKNRPDS